MGKLLFSYSKCSRMEEPFVVKKFGYKKKKEIKMN
jgi:hypothetical protein